jgi:hypothetical protein
MEGNTMQYAGAAVVLDVRRELSHDRRNQIVSHLGTQEGVRQAEFSPHVNRLMIVSYDPKVINSQTIRSHVDRHLVTDGPATCLVDM